jgi:hypothetical protein
MGTLPLGISFGQDLDPDPPPRRRPRRPPIIVNAPQIVEPPAAKGTTMKTIQMCDCHSGPCEDYERVWGEPHPPLTTIYFAENAEPTASAASDLAVSEAGSCAE